MGRLPLSFVDGDLYYRSAGADCGVRFHHHLHRGCRRNDSGTRASLGSGGRIRRRRGQSSRGNADGKDRVHYGAHSRSEQLYVHLAQLHLAGTHRHRDLPDSGLSRGILHIPPAFQPPKDDADAGYASHVDELPSAHLCVDDSAGEKRSDQSVLRTVRSGPLPDDQHPRRRGAGYGIQLSSLYDYAPLFRDDQDRGPHH